MVDYLMYITATLIYVMTRDLLLDVLHQMAINSVISAFLTLTPFTYGAKVNPYLQHLVFYGKKLIDSFVKVFCLHRRHFKLFNG